MAEIASQQGNNAYKAGKLTDMYSLCKTKLDPTEPKYPSNLSAAQYEAGQYVQTVDSISSSWKALEALNGARISDSDALAIKLSTRLAKAKINALQRGSISLHQKAGGKLSKQEKSSAEIESKIETFVFGVRDADPKVKEMQAAWEQWRTIRETCSRHSAEECEQLKETARKRLRALRIFKATSDPAMEYFKFGHDEAQSLMNGLMGNLDDYVMDTKTYRKDEHPFFSFLFGGSGDARHVFATIIHFADFANELGDEKPVDWTSAHFTLVDIHPATLARVTMMFGLLQKILQLRNSPDRKKIAELHATLFYLFTSMFMPEYCRQIIMDLAKELVTELPNGTPGISKCLHIHERSLPAILEVLRYWSTPLAKTFKGFMYRNPAMGSCKRALDMQAPSNKTPDKMMDNLVDGLLGRPKIDMSNPTAPSNSNVPMDPYEDASGEADIYDRTKILLPPRVLLPRHPALAKVVKAYQGVSQAAWAAAIKEVEETWKPNPTLFDQVSTENLQFGGGVGYPAISGSPYDHLFSFQRFSKEFVKGSTRTPKTGYTVTSQFFELAAEAIWTLRNVLKIEMVVGDVITGLPKLLAGDLGPRPETFPKKYSRMFLSNVPDYTQGSLSTAVHLSRYLEVDALVLSNCLLNTGLFRTIREQIFTYAYLPTEDFPRFLGCRVINPMHNAFDDIALQTLKLPRPINELASKKELFSWLALLLLCTLSNGKALNPPMRVELPSNINAFFHVLVHLHHVGFPSHWLGDFVQSMASDNLSTDMVVYEQSVPVPPTAFQARKPSRKVHLAAWKAELEVTLAAVAPALPFSVAIPQDYAPFEEIKTFEARGVAFKDWSQSGDRRLYSLSSPFVKAAGLLFYRATKGTKRDALVRLLPSIIEGQGEMKDVEAQFMLAPDNVNMQTREVSWKMSQKWYEKMKDEAWKMSVFRSDMAVTVTEPVKATAWIQVS